MQNVDLKKPKKRQILTFLHKKCHICLKTKKISLEKLKNGKFFTLETKKWQILTFLHKKMSNLSQN